MHLLILRVSYTNIAKSVFIGINSVIVGALPSSPFPSPALEVGPLNPAREYGERCELPSGIWGRAPAEIALGAFWL